MVESTIVAKLKDYLAVLPGLGIHPSQAVLFGSFAQGKADEYSDIDLIVIAPEFDGSREMMLVEKLWQARISVDNRIEPIPCGEQEWETEQGRPILEIARREGIIIAA
jgi:predicted nucleotidyltransferase